MADRNSRGRKTSSRAKTILIVLLIILAVLIALAAFVLTRTKPDPYDGQGAGGEAGVDFNAGELEEGETIDPEAPTLDMGLAGQELETVEGPTVFRKQERPRLVAGAPVYLLTTEISRIREDTWSVRTQGKH